MKKQILLLIVLLILLGLIYVIFGSSFIANERVENAELDQQGAKIRAEMSVVGCPDQKIVDKMPSVIDDTGVISPPKAYYIKDGKRVEISEYDQIWVSANCEVPVMEVF